MEPIWIDLDDSVYHKKHVYLFIFQSDPFVNKSLNNFFVNLREINAFIFYSSNWFIYLLAIWIELWLTSWLMFKI